MAFSHEKLIVYQKSPNFTKAAYALIGSKNIKGDLKGQLSRAAHGITLKKVEVR